MFSLTQRCVLQSHSSAAGVKLRQFKTASIAAFATAGSQLEITNQLHIVATKQATLEASAALETRALQYSEAARRFLVTQAAKVHPLMEQASEWELGP